ncbi:MAG: hypothetical protein GY737_25770 [Desulfobacteraceae bacterium]|nr:hypothetical protein [Desulfobacteraceae bacterium]
MFFKLFSLLVLLSPTAAAAWFIRPDVPDHPTVVSTALSCETPYKFSVYDDIISKTDDTAFLHTYNPFFVPADMIELDIPLRVLSKQPLSTMEFLDRLLLANLRLRLLIREYEDLQKRSREMLKSVAVPYFDTPGTGAMIVDGKKDIDHHKNSIDHHKKKMETKVSGILHYGFAVHSKATKSAVSGWLDSKSVSLIAGGEEMFRQNCVPPLLEASKSTREPSILQATFNSRDVNNLSLTRSDEVQLPWILRVVNNLILYMVAHKIEVLFYGVVVFLVSCFISLQAKA